MPEGFESPLRLAFDGHQEVLVTFAPTAEEQQSALGVARMSRDGTLLGWEVQPGEDPGRAFCPFDLAVLADGRFVVADLPLGGPRDVRLQLFTPDGRLERVLCEDSIDLERSQRAWFDQVLAQPGDAYSRARIHHLYGGDPEQAAALYVEATAADPRHLLALLGLAALQEPADAEATYREAQAVGGAAGDLEARIADCRAEQGDLDGAIRILEAVVESEQPPEEIDRWLETLGTWYLRRAGDASGDA